MEGLEKKSKTGSSLQQYSAKEGLKELKPYFEEFEKKYMEKKELVKGYEKILQLLSTQIEFIKELQLKKERDPQ